MNNSDEKFKILYLSKRLICVVPLLICNRLYKEMVL